MAERISKADLDQMLRGINLRHGHPAGTERYTEGSAGVARPTVGWYHLVGEWGGWKLAQTINADGGRRDVLGIGAVPKRVMYYLLRAYSSGMDAERGERS